MKIPQIIRLPLLACCFICCLSAATYGEGSWRAEFDAICAHSNNAMALSAEELKTLVERCDRLQKEIDAEEETVRKVFTKRLGLCRNLYTFVLETKQQEQQKK